MSEHTTVGDSSHADPRPHPQALAERGLSLTAARLERFGGLDSLTRSPLKLVARRAATLASLLPQFGVRRLTVAELGDLALDGFSSDGDGVRVRLPNSSGGTSDVRSERLVTAPPGRDGDGSHGHGTADLLTCWLALDAAALLLAALADLDGVRELEALRDELEPALLSGEP